MPSDIASHERKLIESRGHIQNLGKMSDGIFLNAVGLDAILGLIPVLGGVYTTGAGAWMVFLAKRVNAPSSDILILVFLIIADVLMGIFPVFGDIPDAFFRVHGWYSGKFVEHINNQLGLINEAKDNVAQGISVDFDILRHKLFGAAIPVSNRR